jgi:tetratricopeptide (TPR) repeat protein
LHAPPFWTVGLLLVMVPPSRAEIGTALLAPLDKAITGAESSLREGETQAAESRYRSALLEGWLLMGSLERIEGRLAEARDAFRRASVSAVENRLALQALAVAHLQMGEAARAAEILGGLARRNPKDIESHRLLAEALARSGEPERAARELEEAHAAAPGDLELGFALARAYLGLKRTEDASRLFSQIAAARPIPQTRVLIGQAYGEHGELERAQSELRAALKQDPAVRRAHYYLGRALVAEKGMAGLEAAVAAFKAELRLSPQDPLTNLELGMALVDIQRPGEALPALEIAARAEPPRSRTFYYLGRAQLGVDRPAEAVASLRRALDLAGRQGASADQLRVIHNQLGLALRRHGDTEEADTEFAESERLSAAGSEAARERMTRFMADVPDPDPAGGAVLPVVEAAPLAALTPPERLDLKRKITAALARAYLNLGVMQAQGERFSRAAEMFEKAAEVDPEFPQVQYSLGVAYFNARRFDKATGPLARAVSAQPQDAALKRMLGMAWLNTEEYEKAAELLRDDPELFTNPSLQFAYGLALVKSDRAAEAERLFSRLLAQHGDSAELSVLLGQAHAQQGDFDSAIAALQRALQLKADVAEANATLGVIYLKQGRLAEAEAALRAELAGHPAALQPQQNLAVVLEQQQRPEEAAALLRRILQAKPDTADARYLLGKVLLAQGEATEAAEHLEAAARLAPKDANIRYQLGRAYQKLGRAEQAQAEFELFRQLKETR